MSHIRTEPDIFVAGETYIPVKWDFSDLAEVCARYLADDAARIAITQRAYQKLSEYYENFGFAERLRSILQQAGVPHFVQLTGEDAETVPQDTN
jgi:hypothetical protein